MAIVSLQGAAAVWAGESRQLLDLDFLQGSEPLLSPQPTLAFMPLAQPDTPSHHFEGELKIDVTRALGEVEVLTDTLGVAADTKMKLDELPPYSISFVMDGTDIIPLLREPQRSGHPYWEIVAQPGLAWNEAGDRGWSRAALPFTLKEKNQNCTHNGLMMFLYKGDGSISRVAWQITSETCLYLKINLWGIAEATYDPRPIASSGRVITAYRKEVAARLPVKSFSALERDYPEVNQSAFQPAGIDDVSVYGLVMDGVHYRSECPTRYGPYPFCDVLDLPSYSISKSLVGGLGYFMLVNRWPEFTKIPISELIPECVLADRRWNDVTAVHLLNMTTGNYHSKSSNADENAAAMQTFFLAESHQDKVRFSCEAWLRKSQPGEQWVYHTTDTYLLGVAMNVFLKQKLGPKADVYRDLLYQQLFKPLGLSPALQWTQRTYDEVSQAFTGFGLLFHNDDVARIAQILNPDPAINKPISGTDFDTAMFRTGSPWHTVPGPNGLAYSNGFWGVDVSEWIACPGETWIPFMSGYGGISVAIFPHGGVYYYFTDSDQHGFRKAAVEINKALNYCKES